MFKKNKLYLSIILLSSLFILCGAAILREEGYFFPIAYIYDSNIKAYFNGTEIKGYNNDESTLISVEDLKDYGFDVVWDEAGKTISAMDKNRKERDLSQAESVVWDLNWYYFHSDASIYTNENITGHSGFPGHSVAWLAKRIDFNFTYDESKEKFMNKYYFPIYDCDTLTEISDNYNYFYNGSRVNIVVKKSAIDRMPEQERGKQKKIRVYLPDKLDASATPEYKYYIELFHYNDYELLHMYYNYNYPKYNDYGEYFAARSKEQEDGTFYDNIPE